MKLFAPAPARHVMPFPASIQVRRRIAPTLPTFLASRPPLFPPLHARILAFLPQLDNPKLPLGIIGTRFSDWSRLQTHRTICLSSLSPPGILQSTHHPPIFTVLLRSLELPLLPLSATSFLVAPSITVSCGISRFITSPGSFFREFAAPRRPAIPGGESGKHPPPTPAHSLPGTHHHEMTFFCRIRHNHCASPSRKNYCTQSSKSNIAL